MNHAITIGDVVRFLGAVAAVIAILGGALAVFGGMTSDAPEEGNKMTKKGCAWALCGLISLVAMFLGGCASTAPVRTVTVETKVPVAVHPIDPKQIPAPPPPLGPRPKTLPQAADKAFGGWCSAVAFIIRAVPLLNVGAGLPPAQAPRYPECEKH